LVVPAAAASLITKRLPAMMALAVLIAVFSSFAGLIFSYRADVSSGAAIVLISIACFAVAWVVNLVSSRTAREKA
jgi:manganese/iron transport system permease protein